MKAEVFQGVIAQEIPIIYNLNLVLPKVKYAKLEALEISRNRMSLIPVQERWKEAGDQTGALRDPMSVTTVKTPS